MRAPGFFGCVRWAVVGCSSPGFRGTPELRASVASVDGAHVGDLASPGNRGDAVVSGMRVFFGGRAVVDAGRPPCNGSQMPRHLISDAHEWINEILAVPIYYLAKPQPRERAWKNQRERRPSSCLAGLEIPLLASFPYLLGSAERVPYGQWSERACVVGVLARSGLSRVRAFVVCASASRVRTLDGARGSARSRAVARARLNYETPVVSLATSRNPIRGHGQVGSLTGAVHLSKNNAGVLRPAQRGRKPRVEQKGKSWLDPGRSVRVGTAKASASRSSRKR
ncbi:hypothetical protein PGB90_001807 [Kerria lacca]